MVRSNLLITAMSSLLPIPVSLRATEALLTFAPNCSAGTGSASCNLDGLLHLLIVIAVALGIILILVVAFAVHAWRKTKDVDLTRS